MRIQWCPLRPLCLNQVYTAVEDFGLATSMLRKLGLNVDAEGSELMYRPTAGVLLLRAALGVGHILSCAFL
jgi:hypothetical protein